VLRPLGLAAAVAAVAAAVVLALPDRPGDERPATSGERVELRYRLEPAGAAAAKESAEVLRTRLVAAHIDGAQVAVTSAAGVTVTVPAAARADVAALTRPGRLAFYDWERSVLGPDGRPAPADESVTGGQDAGRGAAITKDAADALAAGVPGSRAVRAEVGDGWFVLGGPPALTNAEIASVSVHAGELPAVAVEFTPAGQDAFTKLTRAIARRGDGSAASWQHFVIVLDDRIVNVPYINHLEAPDGIDGSVGAHITGEMAPDDLRRTAAILTAGPLSAALTPQ